MFWKYPNKEEVLTEAANGGVLLKVVFLKMSQNSQENTCVRASFLWTCRPLAYKCIKKRLWQRCFPVNFATFLRIPFLQNTCGWLLLSLQPNNLIQWNENILPIEPAIKRLMSIGPVPKIHYNLKWSIFLVIIHYFLVASINFLANKLCVSFFVPYKRTHILVNGSLLFPDFFAPF